MGGGAWGTWACAHGHAPRGHAHGAPVRGGSRAHELTCEAKEVTLRLGERLGPVHSRRPRGSQHDDALKLCRALRVRTRPSSFGRSAASGVCSHRKVRLRRVPPYFISMMAVEKM